MKTNMRRWVLGFSFFLLATANGFAAEAEVMTLEEAAAFLRLTPEAVRELAETQRIPARRTGEAWRFSRPAPWGGDRAAGPPSRPAPAGRRGAPPPLWASRAPGPPPRRSRCATRRC